MKLEDRNIEDELKKSREDLGLLTPAERERWILEKWDERPESLKVEEVAEIIRVSRSTAYVLTGSGKLPRKRFGTCVRVTRFDLFLFIVRGCDDDLA